MSPAVIQQKLDPVSFDQIKAGTKLIEVRLFDEKRQAIKLSDIIEFSRQPEMVETVQAEVIGLLRYRTFAELTQDHPPVWFGSDDTESLLDKIYAVYSKEDEAKYGVLGIRIKLLG